MSLLSVLLLLQNLFHFGQPLASCDETVTALQLCNLLDTDYDRGQPDSVVHKSATRMNTSITLFSVTEMNEDQSTISMNVLLAMWWNDTRLSLIPKGPDV